MTRLRFVITAVCCLSSNLVAAEPPWHAPRTNRLLVRVEPLPQIKRASQNLVARISVNFNDYLKDDRRCDLSSLVLVEYSPESGQIIDCRWNPLAQVRGDRPFRFYDAAIPWDFPEYEGYAHNNNGTGLPIRIVPRGGYYLFAVGDGLKGTIAWEHTQRGSRPSYYAIYFNTDPKNAPVKIATPGFTGDGMSLCAANSPHFFPLRHSRGDVADLDGDGLPDLIVGNMNGTLLWYRNIGTIGHPVFTDSQIILTDQGQPLDVGYSSAPKLVDWFGNGLLDLLIGAEKESVVVYRNIGTRTHYKFHLEGLLQVDGKPLRVPKAPCKEDPDGKIYPYDYYPVLDAVDWFGHGVPDLLIGGYITGHIWLCENIGTRHEPKLTWRGALQADGKDIDVGWCAAPCAADLRGSGKLDLISGALQMTPGGGDMDDPDKFLWYYENIGTRHEPKLTLRPFPSKGRFCRGSIGTPRVWDYNNDGLPDLVVTTDTDLLMVPNIGTRDKPLFDATVQPMTAKWGNAPASFQQLVDYNHDGWPDLFTGDAVQLNMPLFEGAAIQLRSPTTGAFDGKRIPLLRPGARIYHPTPRGDAWDYRDLVDLDGDGNLDILYGTHEGEVFFHRNRGTNEAPDIDPQGVKLKLVSGEPLRVGIPPTPEEANGFDWLQGARTTIGAADFNKDGKMDLVVCDTYGVIRIFLQAAGREVPTFYPGKTIARLHKIRTIARPVDWNGDGWPDLVVTYAGGETYLLINRAVKGEAEFEPPKKLDVPQYPISWPFLHVADWENCGDTDLLFHYGSMLRFVKRSFLEYGYAPGMIERFETKPKAVPAP